MKQTLFTLYMQYSTLFGLELIFCTKNEPNNLECLMYKLTTGTSILGSFEKYFNPELKTIQVKTN